jgi:hypothetical protein
MKDIMSVHNSKAASCIIPIVRQLQRPEESREGRKECDSYNFKAHHKQCRITPELVLSSSPSRNLCLDQLTLGHNLARHLTQRHITHNIEYRIISFQSPEDHVPEFDCNQ